MSTKDSASPATAKVSDELAALISIINTFSRRLARKLTRREPEFRLGDWLLLKRLASRSPTQMATVARQLGVSRQRAQKQVAELAAQGLVLARGDPEDDRKKQVELTEAGLERLRQLDALVEAEAVELPLEILVRWRVQLQQLIGAGDDEEEDEKPAPKGKPLPKGRRGKPTRRKASPPSS